VNFFALFVLIVNIQFFTDTCLLTPYTNVQESPNRIGIIHCLLVSPSSCSHPSSCHPVMIIRSCSCLCGFISRVAWRRHGPLLAPRPPSLLLTHFSSSSRRRTKKSSAKVAMDSTSEPFYIVRKGDVIGIYKSLTRLPRSSQQFGKSTEIMHNSFLRLPLEEVAVALFLTICIISCC
jgi:hypothetical protein